MKKLAFSVMLFVAMQGALFYGAMMPLKGGSLLSKYASGYPIHFIAFFLTAFSLSLVLSHRLVNFRFPLLGSLAYAFVVAVLVEFLQRYLTTYRTYDVMDMAWGIAGAGAYVLIAKTIIFFYGPEPQKIKK